MGWLEILILCAVALWLSLTVIYLIRRRGKGCTGCGGSCGGCEFRENCTNGNRGKE